MTKIKDLIDKYKDVIPYAFFGVCTTLVNIVAYWICVHLLRANTMVGTIIAWILAVLFAYVTNRKWVFKSEENSRNGILKELVSFFSCRLATGIIDWLFMLIFVTILHWNDMLIKIIANIIVIVLNYVASKLYIFRKVDKNNG